MTLTRPTATSSPARLAPITLLALLAQCGGEPAATTSGTKATTTATATAVAPAAATPPTIVGERIHVIVSGSMLGRLEPCGCASGQLGGLPRRIVHVNEVHGADLLLEGGDLVAGHTPLDLEKAFTAVNVLFGMATRYDALGIGRNDLELPIADWGGYLAAYSAPVVAADLETGDAPLQPLRFVEKDVRGTKVRVVSLTARLPEPQPQGLSLLPPAAAWERGLAGADPATLRILMVHDEPERVRTLARELAPSPDLVLGIDDTYHEPPGQAEMVGRVPVVFPGIRGRYLVDLQVGRTSDGAALPRYELVALRGSETKPDAGQDPGVRQILLDHRRWVAEQKLREAMAGQLPIASGRSYVGSKKCGECHTDDFQRWQNSKHGHAWATLERAELDPKRYGWPVTRYPDCVGCHVVGYGEQSGFVEPAATPDLANVGCEQCHGPGSAHAAAPKESRLGRVGDGSPSMVCTRCHDFEQSPDFAYGTRWAAIEHGKQKLR